MRFEREAKRIVKTVPLLAAAFSVVFTLGWVATRVQFSRWIIQLSAGLLR